MPATPLPSQNATAADSPRSRMVRVEARHRDHVLHAQQLEQDQTNGAPGSRSSVFVYAGSRPSCPREKVHRGVESAVTWLGATGYRCPHGSRPHEQPRVSQGYVPSHSAGPTRPPAPPAWRPPRAAKGNLALEVLGIQEPTVLVNSRAVGRARSWSESRSWLRRPRRQSPSTGCPCRHA